MSRRLHFPDIGTAQTGYGVAWLTCSVCLKDKRIDAFSERGLPPVCDECREEYEWTREEVAP